MLTPKEVEEQVFPKAKKGGYEMQDVDNFLDQLTADFSELYKENAVLKRRMKVLADKITEYQETEGAMRATLLSAQKMADQIVEEAKTKRAKMLDEAEATARERKDQLEAEIAEEEGRLAAAKASAAELTASVLELVNHEKEFLEQLPKMDPAAVAAARPARTTKAQPRQPEPEKPEEPEDDMAEEIGDSISRMLEEAARADAGNDSAPAAAPPEEEPQPRRVARRYYDDDEDEDNGDDTPTRRIDLSELRFGRNYEIK